MLMKAMFLKQYLLNLNMQENTMGNVNIYIVINLVHLLEQDT